VTMYMATTAVMSPIVYCWCDVSLLYIPYLASELMAGALVNKCWRHFIFRLFGFSEACHKYLSSEWEELNGFSEPSD